MLYRKDYDPKNLWDDKIRGEIIKTIDLNRVNQDSDKSKYLLSLICKQYKFDRVRNIERGMFFANNDFIDFYGKKIGYCFKGDMSNVREGYLVDFAGLDLDKFNEAVKNAKKNNPISDIYLANLIYYDNFMVTKNRMIMSKEDYEYLVKGIMGDAFRSLRVEIVNSWENMLDNGDVIKIEEWVEEDESEEDRKKRFNLYGEVRKSDVVWWRIEKDSIKKKEEKIDIVEFDRENFPLE